jgi:hypothetical protein
MSTATTEHHDAQGYSAFRQLLVTAAAHRQGPFFTTDAGDLFSTFLGALPEAERAGYNCNACRQFFNVYGTLVQISDSGQQTPLFFPVEYSDQVPIFFRPAWDKMHDRVRRAQVTGVFLSKEKTWGKRVTPVDKNGNQWSHFYSPSLAVFSHALLSAGQRAAELAEDRQGIKRAVAEFSLAMVDTALRVLSAGNVYRAERAEPVLKWLRDRIIQMEAAKPGSPRENVLWRAAAMAPTGFAHVRNTVVGTLLEDVAAGLDFNAVKTRFEAKMNPESYQRPTAPLSRHQVAVAEDLVAKLGLAPALPRRYVKIDEVRTYLAWAPRDVRPAPRQASGSVFAHLPVEEKAQAAALSPMSLPAQTMTWAKFHRDVLCSAARIEAKTGDGTRFAAITTAVNPEAPPLLAWDQPEARNPFAWYYRGGGIDGEFKRRVEAADGQFENVDIRATLIWHDRSDLDLHCEGPEGRISYVNKRVGHGWLDVDMNVNGETLTPVENIRWPRGRAPAGEYVVSVVNFTPRVKSSPFQVQVQVGGDTRVYAGNLAGMAGERQAIVRFRYGFPGSVVFHSELSSASPAVGADAWNVPSNAWVDVVGILPSPNLWGDAPVKRYGEHLFFLLKNCQDGSKSTGRGLFIEALRSELREVRRTLESYYESAQIEGGAGEGNACGIGMVAGGAWNLELRVTDTSGGVLTYKIDRAE